MPDFEFPAGLWVLRQLEKEVRVQGATLSAHDKWILKRPQEATVDNTELTKRTVSLIRSSITRAKSNPHTPVIDINPQLTIPQDWFESYKTIYLSEQTPVIGDCLQKAFKGCPEWGESEPWQSPRFAEAPDAPSSAAEEQIPKATHFAAAKAPTSTPTGTASVVLGSIAIFIALIGGGALAVPFGLYGISSARRARRGTPAGVFPQPAKLGILLSIIGILLAIALLVIQISKIR